MLDALQHDVERAALARVRMQLVVGDGDVALPQTGRQAGQSVVTPLGLRYGLVKMHGGGLTELNHKQTKQSLLRWPSCFSFDQTMSGNWKNLES